MDAPVNAETNGPPLQSKFLLCAWHFAHNLTTTITSAVAILTIVPLQRGIEGEEEVRNWPEVTQPINARVRTCDQARLESPGF